MKELKVQTGLRIPLERYNELKAIADRSGASFNTIALYLIDIGVSAINLGVEQVSRSLPHIQKHTDGR